MWNWGTSEMFGFVLTARKAKPMASKTVFEHFGHQKQKEIIPVTSGTVSIPMFHHF